METLPGGRGLPLCTPAPERQRVCRQGWSARGEGHPASLSLATLHFQKFFPPVRRKQKSLGSLLGCREVGSQVGTRFLRALTGPAGALGPLAWDKGPAQPWDRGVRRTDQWNWASSCPRPVKLCLWLQNRNRKKEGLEIAGLTDLILGWGKTKAYIQSRVVLPPPTRFSV